jgi:hypothetical protein
MISRPSRYAPELTARLHLARSLGFLTRRRSASRASTPRSSVGGEEIRSGRRRARGPCRNLRGDCGGAPVRVSVARRSARFRNRSMDEAGARQRRGGRQSSLWGSCLGAGRGRAEETRRSGCAGEVRRVRFARWGRSALRSSGAAGDGGGRLASRGADVPSCDRAGDGRWV